MVTSMSRVTYVYIGKKAYLVNIWETHLVKSNIGIILALVVNSSQSYSIRRTSITARHGLRQNDPISTNVYKDPVV